MIVIIGLGNPGEKFKNTRHNAGFMALDEFKEKNNFPEFKISKKMKAELSENYLEEKKIILAKPQTFMNNSGKSVKKLITSYKLQISSCMVIIHDDIDLPLGEIKISKNSGSAGHKGVESIIKELGIKDFTRIRIGICPQIKPENVDQFVLKNFTKEEKEVIKKSAKTIEEFIKNNDKTIINNQIVD